MLEYMENVSQNEAENIRKTIQDLFRQTCILQTKCDPVTLIQKDNPRYQVCARNREFIADYLQVLDCELVHDPQEHIFRITGDGVLTERMTLLTTKLVILMKLIYRDKIMTTCHDNQSCGDPKIWKGNKPDYAQTDRSGVAGGIDPDENTPDDRTAKCHWKSRRRFPDLYLQYH